MYIWTLFYKKVLKEHMTNYAADFRYDVASRKEKLKTWTRENEMLCLWEQWSYSMLQTIISSFYISCRFTSAEQKRQTQIASWASFDETSPTYSTVH